MATQLLLVEDVEDLGRSGEVVSVKPGYARNFLLPKGFAVIAEKGAIRYQEKLKAEREKKAIADRKESEAAAKEIDGKTLSTHVKVDPEGHMYGSVSLIDIKNLIEDEFKIVLEKRSVQLKHPLKQTGVHEIPLLLKEGVECTITLKVIPEESEEQQ